ncbi:MAG: hypothetical protein AAF391_10850, partial [Bacteroidota bacterium]
MNTLPAKEPSSLQFNGISWKISRLGEKVILLQAPKGIGINQIHSSSSLIEQALQSKLSDIVPAYDSIALFCENTVQELCAKLALSNGDSQSENKKGKEIIIP